MLETLLAMLLVLIVTVGVTLVLLWVVDQLSKQPNGIKPQTANIFKVLIVLCATVVFLILVIPYLPFRR